MKLTKLATVLGALAITAGVSQEASAAETLKFGTLAPKQSVWGQVFQVWEKAVAKKSDGKLEISFDYNGVQGDEGSMVGKMKSGQLDGGAVTAVGLSKFYKPVLVMQVPGLLNDWSKVDKALASKGDEFKTGLKDAGAINLGWGFVGLTHVFTKGGAIKKPGDFKGRKPYMWRDDTVAPTLYQILGVTPVGLNVPEVLPNLKTGTIDTIVSPALAVEQLQWASHLDGMSSQTVGAAIGALIMSSKRLDALPGDLRTVVMDTGAIAAKGLTEKIKEADKRAAERFTEKNKANVYEIDESAFKETFKSMRTKLAQGTFDAKLLEAMETAAGLR